MATPGSAPYPTSGSPTSGYPAHQATPYDAGDPQQPGNPAQPGYPQEANTQPAVDAPQQPEPIHSLVDHNDGDSVNAAAGFGNSFSDKAIRKAFIRKVYLVLMVQLFITFGIVLLFTFVKPIKVWVKTHSGAYYASYAIFLVTYMPLSICPSFCRKYPHNYIALGMFTLALSYMTGTIASFYDTQIVIMCLGICVALCLTISVTSIFIKVEFTGCITFLIMALVVLLMFCFIAIFTYSEILFILLISTVSAFTIFLHIEIQKILHMVTKCCLGAVCYELFYECHSAVAE